MSTPDRFNDPFDSTKMMANRFIENNSEDTKKYMKEHDFVNKLQKNLYVVSFSKNVRNPLMWAHYNDYQGVAIEFDLRSFISNGAFRHVEYRQYYPLESKIPIPVENNEIQKRTIFINNVINEIVHVKHISWAYEEEIRYSSLFYPDQKLAPDETQYEKDRNQRFGLKFSEKAIMGLYFGLRINLNKEFSQIEALIHHAKEKYPNIKLYMSFPHRSRIEVDFIDLEDTKKMKERENSKEFFAFNKLDKHKINNLTILERIKYISKYYYDFSTD